MTILIFLIDLKNRNRKERRKERKKEWMKEKKRKKRKEERKKRTNERTNERMKEREKERKKKKERKKEKKGRNVSIKVHTHQNLLLERAVDQTGLSKKNQKWKNVSKQKYKVYYRIMV